MEGLIFGILRYITQNLDLTKPRYSEQILSVPQCIKAIILILKETRDTLMPKSGIDHRCLKPEYKKANCNGRNMTNIGPIITFISICKRCKFQCLEISLLLYGWDVGNTKVALSIIY